MRNMKMKTKLIVGFLIPVVLTIINVVVGNLVTAKMQHVENMQKYVVESTIATTAIALVSILITLYVALLLIKVIEKSVAQLSDAAKDIAMGRVNINMVKYNNDEFGDLVDEYNQVIDNIKYQSEIAKEVSNGNLTITVTPKSPEDLLGNSLKKLVDDNLRTLTNISEAGTQVTISSSQVASASQALAQGSTEQASAIQEITASIDEIADKTKQNADQANSAASLVVRAIDDVKKGNNQMEEMMIAMKDINKASESISKIIQVIDDIAFQTNILALNAAVEAARAGEAGKGFAVVADEIRMLAENSKNTANNIQEISQLVTAAVAKLARNAESMLQFIDQKVLTDYDGFVGVAKQYYDDADNMNHILSDFSMYTADIEDTMKNVNEGINGISTTVDESAKGVASAAENAGLLVDAISQIQEEAQNSENISVQLSQEVKRFKNV